MDESRFIADGEKLGYTGSDLHKYLAERMKRENDIIERNTRAEARQEARLAEERVLKDKELELKRIELELSRTNINRGTNENTVGAVKHVSIKLTPYKDGEDVAVYLRTFEKVKIANGWIDTVAISALHNGFSNTKVGVFMDNICSEYNYSQVKELIIRSFGLTIYDYQKKFRNAKLENESVSQFVLYLKENLSKMQGYVGVEKSFEKLEDLIIKEQLLRGVHRNLSEFLEERDVYKMNMDDLVTVSDNYMAIHGRELVEPKGPYFNTTNNKNKLSCAVTTPNSKDTYDRSSVKCFNCGENHFVKNCPYKHKQSSSEANACEASVDDEASMVVQLSFVSNKPLKKCNLPIATGVCNGETVQVMRDTGSTTNLVKSCFVYPSQLLPGDTVVRYADGTQKKARKASINVESVFFTGKTEAICLPETPFDVTIGNVEGASCACVDNAVTVSKPCDPDKSCAVQTRSQVIAENLPEKATNVGKKEVLFDMNKMSVDSVIKLQNEDITLKKCFSKVNKSNGYPRFIMENGVLIRLCNNRPQVRDTVKQIVLPKVLRYKVMSLAHDTVMSGHLGIHKTQSRVLNHFFWPGVYSEIARYCRSCGTCQRNAITKPAKVPLINLPVIDKPFNRVAIDLIGPLPKSSRGNRFALVSIDLATKYPDAVPLRRIDSDTIAEALLGIYSRVGLPKEILHDQGTQFMSSVMKKFNQLLQIKSINTTPYNPKCNGSCEGFNKCLKQMLKRITEDQPEMWDRYLQPLLFAYREVPQSSTGFAPFELLFGHEVRGPLFLIKENILDPDIDSSEIPVTTYVMEMRERIKQFMQLANDNEFTNKRKEKFYYDRNCRKRNFKLGDKVLLLLPTSSNKLVAEWKGPYEVVRKVNKVDYVVRIGDHERMYHINMLRPFHERIEAQAVPEEIGLVQDCVEIDSPCINNNLTGNQHNSIKRVIDKHTSLFSDVPGAISGVNYKISVDDKVKPIACLPYKVPFHLKSQVESELKRWSNLGIVKKSDSEWAFPVVIVLNSDKSLRITVDYRRLNPHVNVDNYPMSDRDAVISKLGKAKFLTKLDLTKAYFQIPLDESSRKYTSFVTEFGQFEFTCVPFGIRFASGLCNRLVKEILSECSEFVTSFVDDLVIYSDSFDSHLAHVDSVLSELSKRGVTLNKRKCSFAQSTIKFLGVIVTEGTIKPDQSKVEAIRNFPRPVNKKDLRSFLGLLNFYRKFLPRLAELISPLTDLLGKSYPDIIEWTETLCDVYDVSINVLSDDVALNIPVRDVPFVLQTDASGLGISGVLGQVIDDSFKPISFISRKLNKAEQNYSVIELECLAIKWSINYFHEYLYGSRFEIKTDHAPLAWLRQNKDKTSRLMRWALSLQAYDFSITYIKGSENFLADLFSRQFQ